MEASPLSILCYLFFKAGLPGAGSRLHSNTDSSFHLFFMWAKGFCYLTSPCERGCGSLVNDLHPVKEVAFSACKHFKFREPSPWLTAKADTTLDSDSYARYGFPWTPDLWGWNQPEDLWDVCLCVLRVLVFSGLSSSVDLMFQRSLAISSCR
jgi:hypothetical protein